MWVPGNSHRSFFFLLAGFLVGALALLSLKSAEPRAAYAVDLTLALAELSVGAILFFGALTLGALPGDEALFFRWLALGFGAALFAGISQTLARFGFGLCWHKLGGPLELGIGVPYLIFLGVSATAMALLSTAAAGNSPTLAGWAVSTALFVGCYVFAEGELLRPAVAFQTRVLHLAHFALESATGGFGLVTLIFTASLGRRLLSLGFMTVALAAFLYQLVVILRLHGPFLSGVAPLATIGGLFLMHALALVGADARECPLLPRPPRVAV